MRIAGSKKAVDDAVVLAIQEIGDLSKKGASERDIETDIVLLLRQLGWSRPHIRQDVSLSARGIDKADIVITVNKISFLFEVKRNGEIRGAEEQVRRYCRLLTPTPKMAFLTDGIRWTIFYVGREYLLKLAELTSNDGADRIALFLRTMEQFRDVPEDQSSVFEYLDLIDEGLQKRSDFVRANLVGYFVDTILNVLSSPVATTVVPNSPPAPEPVNKAADSETILLLPLAPPLKYSKVKGNFGDQNVTSWNSMVHAAVRMAVGSGMDADQIHQLTGANVRNGVHKESGYSPVIHTEISVQNMEAPRSWHVSLTIAQQLKVPIEAEVTWYPQAPAELQGKMGVLKWNPNSA